MILSYFLVDDGCDVYIRGTLLVNKYLMEVGRLPM